MKSHHLIDIIIDRYYILASPKQTNKEVSDMSDKFTGQCLCGSFLYSIPTIDLEGAFSCHCIGCRRATGSAFAAVVPFKIDNLNGDVSVLKKLTHKGGSGNDLHRYCCQNC